MTVAPVKFSGIYRFHGVNARPAAMGYAQMLGQSSWIQPVCYPYSRDDGLTWSCVLLTEQQAQEFFRMEATGRSLHLNGSFERDLQLGFAQSPLGLDIYV